jgi:hypothetical protein
MANITQIPAPRVAIVDAKTGLISVQWFRYFNNINTIVGGGSGVVSPDSGGTGTNVVPLSGQILIGNASGTYTVANLTAGTGLFRTNGSGSLTVGISNTGVTAGSYGSASSVTTLTVNAQGQLTVAGNVAIAIAASQITSGTLPVAQGGTGLTTLTANRIPYGNGTAAFQSSANLTYDGSVFTAKADIVVDKTITATGTTGAQTINKTAGSVNFAAGAISLIVTNSLVTTSSVILATVATDDATMRVMKAVPGAGSFTLISNAAATAETRVNFLVLN